MAILLRLSAQVCIYLRMMRIMCVEMMQKLWSIIRISDIIVIIANLNIHVSNMININEERFNVAINTNNRIVAILILINMWIYSERRICAYAIE